MSLHDSARTILLPALKTVIVHPLEYMRVHSVLNPEAPLVTDAFKSTSAFGRGFLTHAIPSILLASARTFITPYVRAFFARIAPKFDSEETPSGLGALVRHFWQLAPILVVQNLLLVATYPATLVTTIAMIPDISANMNALTILDQVHRRHGFQGIFAGLLPDFLATCLHTVTITPICNFVYGTLMNRSMATISTYNRQDQGALLHKAQRKNLLISSAVAHLCMCVMIMPFSVVSTQLRIAAGMAGPLPSSAVVASSLWSKYGASSILIGAVPYVLKHAINSAMVNYIISQQNHERSN